MTIGEGIAREIEAEAKTTTRFLERFDDARADFKPHDRSMSAARLAGHIVESPEWALSILKEEVFDFAASGYKPPVWNTKAELLENHDRITAAFTAKLRENSDETLLGDWEMRTGEKVFFKGPRVVAIRAFIISHLIHHRGQLSVYYRLLGIPVPGAYGPSADDPSPTASGGDGDGQGS